MRNIILLSWNKEKGQLFPGGVIIAIFLLDFEIEPRALAERIKQGDSLRIIDVREPEEVQEQPFVGAENIPLDSLPQCIKELDPKQELIINCRSRGRLALAAKYLIQERFENDEHFKDGIKALQREGEPILTATH